VEYNRAIKKAFFVERERGERNRFNKQKRLTGRERESFVLRAEKSFAFVRV